MMRNKWTCAALVFGLTLLAGLASPSRAHAFPSQWISLANPIRIPFQVAGLPIQAAHTVLVGPAVGGIPSGTMALGLNVTVDGTLPRFARTGGSGVFAFAAYQGNDLIGFVTGRVVALNDGLLMLVINPNPFTKAGVFQFAQGNIFVTRFGINLPGTFASGLVVFPVNQPLGFFFF